jgi:hypothetical protein
LHPATRTTPPATSHTARGDRRPGAGGGGGWPTQAGGKRALEHTPPSAKVRFRRMSPRTAPLALTKSVWPGEPKDFWPNTPTVEHLFQQVLPFVDGLVRAGGVPPQDSVSDRAQDTCARILVKLNQFDGAQQSPEDEAARANEGAFGDQSAACRLGALLSVCHEPRGKADRFTASRSSTAGSRQATASGYSAGPG